MSERWMATWWAAWGRDGCMRHKYGATEAEALSVAEAAIAADLASESIVAAEGMEVSPVEEEPLDRMRREGTFTREAILAMCERAADQEHAQWVRSLLASGAMTSSPFHLARQALQLQP